MPERTVETGTDHVLARVEDRVAVITLNRPERRNALSGPMLRGLALALDDAERASDVGAVVLTMGEKTWRATLVELNAQRGFVGHEQLLIVIILEPVITIGRGLICCKRGIFFDRHVAQITNQVHDFVITEQQVHDTACGFGVGLESHYQIHDSAGIGSTIQKIACNHKMRLARGPVQRLIQYAGILESADHRVIVAVYIADCHHTLDIGPSPWLRHIDGEHVNRCQRDCKHQYSPDR